MTDTPMGDILKKHAKTTVLVSGEATDKGGAGISGQLAHESDKRAIGVEAGISQKQGWTVKGFFKRVWGG